MLGCCKTQPKPLTGVVCRVVTGNDYLELKVMNTLGLDKM